MDDLKAVAVSVPGLDLEIYIRPFDGWYVITGDSGDVVENIIAIDDDPDEAWRSAVAYLNDVAAASAERPGGETKVDLTNWNPEDDE